ncbi:MAG: ribosome maturation factor RimP [Kangiellaceae bacterium]|nr:ribosome maturation factor RimP [Kangiellaceae bacterium]
MAKHEELEQMIRPAVEATGFELWGIEYLAQGKHSVLRIFIDHENGINVDDCAEVSHQVSGVLDLEDPIKGLYNLEVSSPGMDRPLFNEQQFARYVGEEVELRVAIPINGRRKFKGVIEQVNNGVMTLLVDGESHEIICQQVDKANLVAKY